MSNDQATALQAATPDDLRSITEPGAESLTDAQAEHLKANLIGLGYQDYVIPGPVWQRYINLAKAEA